MKVYFQALRLLCCTTSSPHLQCPLKDNAIEIPDKSEKKTYTYFMFWSSVFKLLIRHCSIFTILPREVNEQQQYATCWIRNRCLVIEWHVISKWLCMLLAFCHNINQYMFCTTCDVFDKSFGNPLASLAFWVRLHSVDYWSVIYRQISNKSRTKSENLIISRFVLQLFLPDLLKPCVGSKMKM